MNGKDNNEVSKLDKAFRGLTQAKLGNRWFVPIEETKPVFKKLMLELIDEAMPEGTYHVNTEVLQRLVNDL